MTDNNVRRARYYIDKSADFFALYCDMTARRDYNLRQKKQVKELAKLNGNAFTVIVPDKFVRWLFDTHREFFYIGSDGIVRWSGTCPLELLTLKTEAQSMGYGFTILWHGQSWTKRSGDRPANHEQEIALRLSAMEFNGETYTRTGSIHKKGNGYNPDCVGSNGTTIECKGIDGRFTVKALEKEGEE